MSSSICDLLALKKGVIALIGGGGKTTLLYKLAEELGQRGRVLIGTTTKIYPPVCFPLLLSPTEAEVRAQLAQTPVVCVGKKNGQGKLTDCGLSVDCLRTYADFVLLEADGSAGLPFKAHRDGEPVIPVGTNRVILVLGASGFGRPIREVAHCPELYALRCGAAPDDAVTPALAAAVLQTERLEDTVLINQVETAERHAFAVQLAEKLRKPVFAGSLWKGVYECLR